MDAPRSRVLRHESELGRWELALRAPAPALRSYLTRPYTGFVEERPGSLSRREVPIPTTVLIVNFGLPFRVSGEEYRSSFLAGLADSYAITEYVGKSHGIQIDLTPPGAHVILGMPMSELANRVVHLEDVLGADAERLTARLYELPTWDQRFDLLDDVLSARLESARPPSPDVAWAWRRLLESSGGVEIRALTDTLGCSRRHLVSRFHEQVGLPPKTVARILRFNRVIRMLLRDDGSRFAEIAHRCGYYDQSHLNRDFRELAGVTPSEFLSQRLADDMAKAGEPAAASS
jgi:AraC-like DNA-binding protein